MNDALFETKRILETNFSENQKEIIAQFFEKELTKIDYSPESIWYLDSLIGGVGGYMLPADATINPFPSGIEREFFRPLQYARSDIDICDIRVTSRYVVQNSGLHLEAVLKHYLMKKGSFVHRVKNIRKQTLGSLVYQVKQLNEFDEQLVESLLKFVDLYNKSKHHVNQDEKRKRLLNPIDAIVAYFFARMMGVVFLEKSEFYKRITLSDE